MRPCRRWDAADGHHWICGGTTYICDECVLDLVLNSSCSIYPRVRILASLPDCALELDKCEFCGEVLEYHQSAEFWYCNDCFCRHCLSRKNVDADENEFCDVCVERFPVFDRPDWMKSDNSKRYADTQN